MAVKRWLCSCCYSTNPDFGTKSLIISSWREQDRTQKIPSCKTHDQSLVYTQLAFDKRTTQKPQHASSLLIYYNKYITTKTCRRRFYFCSPFNNFLPQDIQQPWTAVARSTRVQGWGTSLVSRLSACLTEANWWRLIAEWNRLEAERTEGNQYWSALSKST